MANKYSKVEGAPAIWDSMAGFLPAFVVVMAVLLIATFVLKGIIG